MCVFLCFLFYGGIGVTTYTLKTEKLKVGESIKFLLITDLHSHIYEPRQLPLIQKIKAQAPDVILLSGDILDDYASDLGTH
jgi:hypothetical protein